MPRRNPRPSTTPTETIPIERAARQIALLKARQAGLLEGRSVKEIGKLLGVHYTSVIRNLQELDKIERLANSFYDLLATTEMKARWTRSKKPVLPDDCTPPPFHAQSVGEGRRSHILVSRHALPPIVLLRDVNVFIQAAAVEYFRAWLEVTSNTDIAEEFGVSRNFAQAIKRAIPMPPKPQIGPRPNLELQCCQGTRQLAILVAFPSVFPPFVRNISNVLLENDLLEEARQWADNKMPAVISQALGINRKQVEALRKFLDSM